MSIKIDVRGFVCFKLVINIKRELDNLEEGVVVIIVDNEIVKENILKFVKFLSCEVNIVDEKENFIFIEIRKGKNILDK